MDDLLQLSERPAASELYMLAGWRQWADAGAVSSGLPEYLIDQTGARKIGDIRADSFYLFQLPGTQHFLRPEIKLEHGHRQELRKHRNEIYYSENKGKGLVIFLGDEPHLNEERYADVFFNMVKELGIKRVVAVGGVYAAVPYDKDREISCTYSLPRMQKELAEYAVHFSGYEGGATIGSFLTERAEQTETEYLVFHAMVPMYDLSELSEQLESMMIEQDWKGWYDLTRRINHMFKLGLDLSDLEEHAQELTESVRKQVDELEAKSPETGIRSYVDKLAESFPDTSFMPLDDAWERGLGDLLEGMDK